MTTGNGMLRPSLATLEGDQEFLCLFKGRPSPLMLPSFFICYTFFSLFYFKCVHARLQSGGLTQGPAFFDQFKGGCGRITPFVAGVYQFLLSKIVDSPSFTIGRNAVWGWQNWSSYFSSSETLTWRLLKARENSIII